MEPIALVLLVIGSVAALISLRKSNAIHFSSPTFLAGVSLIAGLMGIVIALVCVAGNGGPIVMTGVLVSASILFGCGTIALAVIKKSG